MSGLRGLALLSTLAKVVHGARHSQGRQAATEPVSLSQATGGVCSAAVEDSTALPDAAARRLRGLTDCSCSGDFSLLGDDEACGDGSQTEFRSTELTAKGCQCVANKGCPTVETVPDFNLTDFISARWFVQQQMVTRFLPTENNFCVTAGYEIKDTPSFPWRYTITVMNSARVGSVDGEKTGGDLCAYKPGEDPARLGVAPCFVPRFASGPYWVLAYSETEGYALVSGGQPTIATPTGCRMEAQTNDSGLWIFTREALPRAGLVETVRDLAVSQGFDLSVLNDVTHEGCSGPGYDVSA